MERRRRLTGAAVSAFSDKSSMPFDRTPPDTVNAFQLTSALLIMESHQRLTGRALLQTSPDAAGALQLYNANFVVLAHDTAADPVFFYANRKAQQIFEMSWDEMVRLPSRQSAEPLGQSERQRLLERVYRQGYIDDYSGVRVARSGQRFRIEQARVWNLLDRDGGCQGQAASFDHWILLGADSTPVLSGDTLPPA